MNTEPIEVSAINGVWSYLQSIDWSEPWLQAVLGFHSCCMTLTFLTRNHQNVQIALFLIYLAIVYFAEYINEKAALYWKLFSKQQYFDSNGLFISVILLAPMLLNCLVMVGMWVYGSIDLLVKVKRLQLRREAKNRQLEQTSSETADSQSEKTEANADSQSEQMSSENTDSQSEKKEAKTGSQSETREAEVDSQSEQTISDSEGKKDK